MNKKKIAIISGCTALFLGAVAISPNEELEKEDNNYIQNTEKIENTDENTNDIRENTNDVEENIDNKEEPSANEEEITKENEVTSSPSNSKPVTNTNTDIKENTDSERLPLKAICNDGTISYQHDVSKENYRGMCSHHGGIKEKLGRQKWKLEQEHPA